MIRLEISTQGIQSIALGCDTTKQAMAIVEAVTGKNILDYNWDHEENRYWYDSGRTVEVTIVKENVLDYEGHLRKQEEREEKHAKAS